jgi:zinc transport system substrate-binding protein
MPAHHHEDGDGDHEKISPDAEHKDGDKPGEDHEAESGLDPHVWLSPSRVRIMAGHVLTTLKNLDPAHALVYEENHRRFMDEIQALDQDLKTVLGPFKGQSFLVYHPAWGYLADDYGLKQVAVEVEGKEPKPAQLAEMIDHAKEAGIRMIFAQPQMSPKSAQVIAQAVGGRVVMGDPMAEDWAGNLRRMAQQISGKQP